jgi:hypothetical protein
VFNLSGSNVLQPLVDNGVASSIDEVDDLIMGLQSNESGSFDRERFFKSNSVVNIIEVLESVKQESA